MKLRLAYHPEGGRTLIELKPPHYAWRMVIERSPTMRLAYNSRQPRVQEALAPTLRLAHTPGAQGDNCLTGSKGVTKLAPEQAPALLVSYVYLKPFLRHQQHYMYRDWALDSGAFSAHMSGDDINLDDYMAVCKDLMKSDKTLTEIFSLDVIGDWKAGLKNCQKM